MTELKQVALKPVLLEQGAQLKVVLLGPVAAGKTWLFQRLRREGPMSTAATTIGVDFEVMHLTSQAASGRDCGVVLWDTGGQERFHSQTASYLKGASVALLCFDLTRTETLSEALRHRVTQTRDLTVILVGLKADLNPRMGLRVMRQFGQVAGLPIVFFSSREASQQEGRDFVGQVLAACLQGNSAHLTPYTVWPRDERFSPLATLVPMRDALHSNSRLPLSSLASTAQLPTPLPPLQAPRPESGCNGC